MFLSALGEPVHFPATDVIRRPLGDPCRRALRRLLLERGEMRLARHAPPYEWHSPRRPVTGLAGHLALRAAAHPREGPRGRAHSWAAQGGYAPRGGTRASTFRENTNGSSGVCMGCCLDEDARLAAALAQSLPSRQGGGDHRGGRRRHTMALEPLVPPDSVRVATRIAARTILASQQCTRMPQNGAKRPFLPICVHSCVLTSVHNGATVYTNGPKQLQEAVFANLCTLFAPGGKPTPQVPAPGRRATRPDSRDRAVSRVPRHRRPHGPRDARVLGPEAHATGTVTQPPTHTNSRSLLR